jgi:hypothetical protein
VQAAPTPAASTHVPVPLPIRGPRPTAQDLLVRTTAHPEEVISTWNPDLFERFTHEWVFSCAQPKYAKVVWAAGSGDKGRDVRAYVTDEQGEWDSYQCKRYDEMLTPSVAWLELGKLCYFTHLGPMNGGYRCPRAYFFIAQHGLGPKLQDMVEEPNLLRQGLIQNWKDKCREELTSKPVELEDELLAHIQAFPFKIVSHKTLREMVKDLESTPYYSWFFGYRKFVRDALPPIPTSPDDTESRYVNALYHAYADHLKCPSAGFGLTHLDPHEEIRAHFRESRECF